MSIESPRPGACSVDESSFTGPDGSALRRRQIGRAQGLHFEQTMTMDGSSGSQANAVHREIGALELPFPLRAYQEDGVSFLLSTTSALLADEMGLGKTVQAIVAMRLLAEAGQCRRILIVTPRALRLNWAREFSVWAPNLIVRLVKGSAGTRAAESRDVREYLDKVGSVGGGDPTCLQRVATVCSAAPARAGTQACKVASEGASGDSSHPSRGSRRLCTNACHTVS